MLRLTDIAAAIAAKHDMPQREAERFLTTMIGVMNDALGSDKQLKVKGLGSFKVTSVNARQSVSINTGDRIMIEGREKISFTPETALKNLVNKPFAQFETVVVNPGVDFSKIDEKYGAGIPDVPSLVEEVEVEVLPDNGDTADQMAADASDCEADVNLVPGTLPHDNTADSEGEATVFVAEEDLSPDLSFLSDASSAPEQDESTEPEEKEPLPQKLTDTENMKDKHENEFEEKFDEYGYPVSNSNEIRSLTESLKKKNRLIKSLIAALVLVVAGSLFGMWQLNKQVSERNNRIDHLVAQIREDQGRHPHHEGEAPVAPPRTPDRADAPASKAEIERRIAEHDRQVKKMEEERRAAAIQQEEAIKRAEAERRLEEQRQAQQKQKEAMAEEQRKAQQAKAAAEAQKKQQAQAKPAPQPATTANKKPSSGASAQAQAKYNEDARVRTGAYVITGVSETVTVRQGQTLAGISKAYLGPGMECYVEAVNGGIKEVTPGQKLKIPSLSLKKNQK